MLGVPHYVKDVLAVGCGGQVSLRPRCCGSEVRRAVLTVFTVLTVSVGLGAGMYALQRFWDKKALQLYRHELPPYEWFSWRAWQDKGQTRRPTAGAASAGQRTSKRGNEARDGAERVPPGSEQPATAGVPGMETWPAAADAVVAGFSPALALVQIDPTVVEAADFAFREDLGDFGNLRDLVMNAREMDPEAYAGWFARLQGYVGEQVAAGVLEKQGFEVDWPDTPNHPGWDLLIDGQPYNVKVTDDPDLILEHFRHYPDIPVITSPDMASQLPPELQDHVLAVEGLEPGHIANMTETTLANIEAVDFGPSIPIVTAAVSAFREIRLLVQGVTDPGTSLRNAALDIAGTGIGGWVGAKIGAGIGTAILPGAGTVVGGILGGIAGSLVGRGVTNEIKLGPYRRAVERYEQEAARFRESVTTGAQPGRGVCGPVPRPEKGPARRRTRADPAGARGSGPTCPGSLLGSRPGFRAAVARIAPEGRSGVGGGSGARAVADSPVTALGAARLAAGCRSALPRARTVVHASAPGTSQGRSAPVRRAAWAYRRRDARTGKGAPRWKDL